MYLGARMDRHGHHPRLGVRSLAGGCARLARPQGVEEGYMTVETIHLDDVDGLVADGSLRDETTVLGLYLARQHLRATGRRP